MNKLKLVRTVAAANDLPFAVVKKVLNDMLRNITDAMSNGERVTLENFGTFSIRYRAERKGRHPQTGQSTG